MVEIPKSAQDVATAIFKRYKDAVKSGTPLTEALNIGTCLELQKKYLPNLKLSDVESACDSLKKSGLISMDKLGAINLSKDGLSSMEDQLKDGLKSAAGLLGKLKL